MAGAPDDLAGAAGAADLAGVAFGGFLAVIGDSVDYTSRNAFMTASRLFFASPKSMRVLSLKNRGFSTPA